MKIDETSLRPSLRDRLRVLPAADRDSLDRVPIERSRRQQLHHEMAQLRDSVASSLQVLLMTRQASSVSDWRRWPHAEASVLNFGVPDLSGLSGGAASAKTMQRKLKKIIERFEPRIHEGTLELELEVSSSQPEALMLWVGGDIGPRDAPEAFRLGMSICLVTGHANHLQR